MTFFTDPAFFILALATALIALVVTLMGKRVKTFGLIVSVFFLLLLFSDSLLEFLSFLFYVVLACVVTYSYKRACAADRGQGALYAVCLILMVTPLAIYKVAEVFDSNFLGFMGISYMMFRAVQVIIETHAGLIKNMSFFDYLYFLLFFPVFTSGPITRSRSFIEEANEVPSRDEYLKRVSVGMMHLAVGAFYKFVCASIFAVAMWFVPRMLGTGTVLASLGSQIGEAYAYGLYLFFDFAGYSRMAMGLGAFFGIRVPRNFDAPFISKDIIDFWNRWHMTLSFWLRDFVFMRLTRILVRKKMFASRLATANFGFVAEMLLMGLWHGVTPSYILYGLYHGILLAATNTFQKKSKLYKKHKDDLWFKVISWFITINLVMFGFALFSGQVLGV